MRNRHKRFHTFHSFNCSKMVDYNNKLNKFIKRRKLSENGILAVWCPLIFSFITIGCKIHYIIKIRTQDFQKLRGNYFLNMFTALKPELKDLFLTQTNRWSRSFLKNKH